MPDLAGCNAELERRIVIVAHLFQKRGVRADRQFRRLPGLKAPAKDAIRRFDLAIGRHPRIHRPERQLDRNRHGGSVRSENNRGKRAKHAESGHDGGDSS